jgi:hypothetical protein
MKPILVASLLFAFILAGCSKPPATPTPVGEMNDYRDVGYGYKVKYPKDWKQMGTAGKAVFAPSQDVVDKFQDPASGIEGSMATAEIIKLEGRTTATAIAAAKDELKQTWQGLEAMPATTGSFVISGKTSENFGYTIPVTAKKKIIGLDIYVPGDTAVYKLSFLSFGEDQATMNTEIMNAMIKSFEIPAVVAKTSDRWNPSPNLETYTSPFFTMQYPDNLEIVPVQKGDKDLAMEMRADRRDCSIHIDVFGAKKLTVDKVWDQNKAKYKAKGTGTTTIDGEKAFWVDYTPMANISSRAWFVVKNDKVVRTTVNYYAPQKDIYFTVFENAVKSIKLK